MKKTTAKKPQGTAMRREYDFSNAVRGKFSGRFRSGFKVVIHKPDGSQLVEVHRKDGAVTKKATNPPQSRELRLRVPVKTMAKLKKVAAAKGVTEQSFVKTLIEQSI